MSCAMINVTFQAGWDSRKDATLLLTIALRSTRHRVIVPRIARDKLSMSSMRRHPLVSTMIR